MDPIVDVLGLLSGEVKITGPDEQGVVWLSVTPPGEATVRTRLGHVGTPAAEAGLRWRRQLGLLGAEA